MIKMENSDSAILLTSAQMRRLEQAAVSSGQVTGLELMERAGQGVVDAIFAEWTDFARTSHRAAILCGPGNNGGDGFVVARLLHDWGWTVDVFLYGDPDKLLRDAKVNYERWQERGICKALTDSFETYCTDHPDTVLIIDALFGSGLSRPLRGLDRIQDMLFMASVDQSAQSTPKVAAIDVPSGLCADSGRYLRHDTPFEFAIAANLTVTFQTAFTGHYLGDGPRACGRLAVKDIGLGDVDQARAVRLADITARPLSKSFDWHKYAYGHAFIFSGPANRTGAARLAVRGALRIGAGLVTIGAPQSALLEHAAQLDAVMLTEINTPDEFKEKVLADPRVNAFCIGPGFGLMPDRVDLLAAVLQARRRTVVDADALTLIACDSALFDLLHSDCVLTPHMGEFARLFPDLAEQLNAIPTKGPAFSKVDAVRAAAKRAGCAVVLKGLDTVIAHPDGPCIISAASYARAAPWLATAGSGDVLAGFITGLMARGFRPLQAAETAAWLHVECARTFGPGLIAEDLPEQLPVVLHKLNV